jgi:4-amino-4-deoxy-L-arabinose transferase-like glycosyltransferase
MQMNIMAATLEAKYKEHKDDIVNLTFLVLIASALGIYLIATTVLIADDGIYYIERAQKLSTDPSGVMKLHPPGYPCLIFLAHKFVMLFSNSSSVFSWIYSAQSVTLLCRLFALIPLYFIGKFLIGGKKSFWAILILLILPYPARFGSDVLRGWPLVLFLATGFLFLLWGAERGKWWFFGIVGLAAGLGFTIRPECVQLVVYSILWLLVGLLRPKCNMSRPKLLCALFILLIGFALPIAPYVIEAGRIIPPKLGGLIDFPKEHITSFFQAQSENEPNVESDNSIYTIVSSLGNITKAIGRLVERISENLMYFFVPALLIGIYCRFRKQSSATDIERFFMPVFIILNCFIMILLYSGYEYISRRHCLSLVVFLIFYVVTGLEVLGSRLGSRNTQSRSEAAINSRRWFFILLAIGIGICLPKLFRPNRIEKKNYRAAAQWLREQSGPQDLVVIFDSRIAFYAERQAMRFTDDVPSDTKYLVRKFKSRENVLAYGGIVKEGFSLVSQWQNGDSVVAIYGAAN